MKMIFSSTLAMLLVIAFASTRLSAEETQSSEMRLCPATSIEWKPGPAAIPPGAKMAVLEGDPTKEGPFVVRFKFPDGYHIPPHTHPKTERVTVISGKVFCTVAIHGKSTTSILQTTRGTRRNHLRGRFAKRVKQVPATG
jgi:hypothetical protein